MSSVACISVRPRRARTIRVAVRLTRSWGIESDAGRLATALLGRSQNFDVPTYPTRVAALLESYDPIAIIENAPQGDCRHTSLASRCLRVPRLTAIRNGRRDYDPSLARRMGAGGSRGGLPNDSASGHAGSGPIRSGMRNATAGLVRATPRRCTMLSSAVAPCRGPACLVGARVDRGRRGHAGSASPGVALGAQPFSYWRQGHQPVTPAVTQFTSVGAQVVRPFGRLIVVRKCGPHSAARISARRSRSLFAPRIGRRARPTADAIGQTVTRRTIATRGGDAPRLGDGVAPRSPPTRRVGS